MSDLAGRPRRSRHDTRQLWTERLARYSASTLSVAAFCAAEGVSPNSLFYWKRRLGTDPTGAVAPVLSDGAARFVPVRIPAPGAAVEIVLPGGAVLRLSPGCDLSFVRSLLDTLAGASC